MPVRVLSQSSSICQRILIKILPREAEISLASMIASVARSGDESESLNAFKLVEADDD
jgi:hypothetical protein